MNRITKETAPSGARLLVTDDDHPSLRKPVEVTVLEWSDGGRVKLRYPSGAEYWLEDRKIPFLIEVLPAEATGVSVWSSWQPAPIMPYKRTTTANASPIKWCHLESTTGLNLR